MDNNYLQHHGRLGQRWGKKNGPPYPLSGSGNKAFMKQKAEGEKKDDKAKKTDSPNNAKPASSKPKSEKEMTDDELKAAVLRLANEKKYREYMREEQLRQVSKGKKYVKSFLDKMGDQIVNKASEKAAALVVNKIFSKFEDSKDKDDNKKNNTPSKEATPKKTSQSSGAPKVKKEAYTAPSMDITYLLPDFKKQKR